MSSNVGNPNVGIWISLKRVFSSKFLKTKWVSLIHKLKAGDIKSIVQYFLFSLITVAGFLLAIPIIIFLFIIKPFIWIRMGMLTVGRIGDQATFGEVFMRRKKTGVYPKEAYYLNFYDPRKVCNEQLIKMTQELMGLHGSVFWCYFYYGMSTFLKKTPFNQPLYSDSNEYSVFQSADSSIQFTPSEMQTGGEILGQMGIELGKDWFVCVASRDRAYLDKVYPGYDKNKWSYHDYRNSDIDTYREAIKFIIDQGGYVVRVGSVVEKAVSFEHPRFIDYSMTDFRSEFMDVFLIGQCRFYLGDGSGLHNLSWAFDKHVLSVNYSPFGKPPYGRNTIYIPKRFKRLNTDEDLSFLEAAKMGLGGEYYGNRITERGVKVHNNSPQEILDATKEMYGKLEGSFVLSEDEEALLDDYFTSFLPTIPGKDIKTPIGIKFLKDYKNLFFEDEKLS